MKKSWGPNIRSFSSQYSSCMWEKSGRPPCAKINDIFPFHDILYQRDRSAVSVEHIPYDVPVITFPQMAPLQKLQVAIIVAMDIAQDMGQSALSLSIRHPRSYARSCEWQAYFLCGRRITAPAPRSP